MLQAIGDTKQIVLKAKQLEHNAIAITDTNAGYGLLEFYEKTGGIKPIL
jgi:DNA polymerase III alpha subunit